MSSLYPPTPAWNPPPAFNLNETQSFFHCSRLELFSHTTPVCPCKGHVYSRLPGSHPFQGWQGVISHSGVLPVLLPGWGIYHILVSFLHKRNFQCLPTVLFPHGEAILFFSTMFRAEETRQMELWAVVCLPTWATKGGEEGTCNGCETAMSKRNQELSGHQRASCLVMSLHREEKAPARGGIPQGQQGLEALSCPVGCPHTMVDAWTDALPSQRGPLPSQSPNR